MIVTMICDAYGMTENNGTTIATLNLIRHLRAQGHEVRIVSAKQEMAGSPGAYTVPQLDLGPGLNRILENNGVGLAKPDKKILTEAIRDADVVHLQVPFPLSVNAVKIARKMHKPVTASFHCQAENITAHIGMMRMQPVNHLIYLIFRDLVYRYVDAVHYPTDFIRETFERHTGRTYPSYVISNGVNDVFYRKFPKSPHEKFTVVCTGRYSREKDQDVLIRAVGRSRYRDRIRVIFAGMGPKEKKLRRRAKRLGVDAVFRFFGREELAETLQNADLYVHTAPVEIEAISCLEAIACGLVPVICDSPKSATPRFALFPENLFRPGNAEELKGRIEFLYEHPQRLKTMRARYLEEGRSLSVDRCMEEMERMLAETVQKKGAFPG